MTQKRYMTLYEKVKRKELKVYIYKRLERILKGIHLELLTAKLRDAEAIFIYRLIVKAMITINNKITKSWSINLNIL